MISPMSQIYLFTGENNFLLRQKKRLWIDQFVEKHGDENLSRINARDTSFRALLDEVSVMPFIAKKRLVMVYGIPKCEKEEISTLSNHIHPDVLLLFVEQKLDKRLSATKELLKIAEVEECNSVIGNALRTWITKFTASLGGTVEPKAVEALIELLGEDQDLLSQELQKLTLYAKGRPVTAGDVEELVMCSGERQVWGLMDLIGQRKEDEALKYIQRLMQQGESAQGLWHIFLWMMSSLVPVASAVESGVTNPGAIAKQYGVSFGSARALLPIARKFSKEEIKNIVDQVIGFDIDLKTGGFRATEQEPHELQAIIDRSILACCDK